MNNLVFRNNLLGKKAVVISLYLDTNRPFLYDQEINHDITSCIITVALREYSHFKVDAQSTIKQLCSHLDVWYPNLKNVYVFYVPCMLFTPWKTTKFDLHFIPFDWFLCKTHPDYIKGLTHQSKSLGNNKAIAMFGDSVNRIHKLGFLQYADKCNVLDLFDYSMTNAFHRHDQDDIACAENNHLDFTNSHSSPQQAYLKYVKKFNNDCGLEFEKTPNDIFARSSTHYPDNVNHASLMFVVETEFGLPYNYCTEKSWKPIVCKLPFVSMTYNDLVYQYFDNLGFRTFVEYTNIEVPQISKNSHKYTLHNLDSSLSKEDYVFYFDTAINRVSNFLNSMHKYRDRILEDIEHNYNLLAKLRDAELEKLNLCPLLRDLDPIDTLNTLVN